MMWRREFISLLGGAAAWPIAARGQQIRPRVGILDSVGPSAVATFRKGLGETDHIEGVNVATELRSSDEYDLGTLADDLVRRQVSAIAAIGGPSAPAAKAATSTIPIVFCIGGDPIELGLVMSLNRPGGNVTGVTFFTAELLQKQIGLLSELVPKASVFGVLVNSNNPRARADADRIETAVRMIGREVLVVNAGAEIELVTAFERLSEQRAGVLLTTGDPFFLRARTFLAALQARHRIPAISAVRENVEAGTLMSYGASITDAFYQCGIYCGRVLNGERPGDLPVMQPSKFEFVINLQTAKGLGLTIPPTLLALATEVIE